MSQLTLFDSGEVVLADDERGRITYTPRMVDAATAAAWFRELRTAVQWRSERRLMYDREVDVPRLMGHFRLDAVSPLEAPLPNDRAAGDENPLGVSPGASSIPAAIRDAARLVVAAVGVPFNSVGLNLYRDGRDSVAPHNDHLNELRKGSPIALVSLGAVRRMTIRAKEAPRRVLHVDLEAGSLLVMDYATQLHYTHAVPKTADPVGERISLAFRVKRRDGPSPTTPAPDFYR
jgi:alkylated DNA repair dioxygenase AlkB